MVSSSHAYSARASACRTNFLVFCNMDGQDFPSLQVLFPFYLTIPSLVYLSHFTPSGEDTSCTISTLPRSLSWMSSFISQKFSPNIGTQFSQIHCHSITRLALLPVSSSMSSLPPKTSTEWFLMCVFLTCTTASQPIHLAPLRRPSHMFRCLLQLHPTSQH